MVLLDNIANISDILYSQNTTTRNDEAHMKVLDGESPSITVCYENNIALLLPLMQHCPDTTFTFNFHNQDAGNLHSDEIYSTVHENTQYSTTLCRPVLGTHYPYYTNREHRTQVNIIFRNTRGMQTLLDCATYNKNWEHKRLTNYETYCTMNPKHKICMLYEQNAPTDNNATLIVWSSSFTTGLYVKLMSLIPAIFKDFLKTPDETIALYDKWLKTPPTQQIEVIQTDIKYTQSVLLKMLKITRLQQMQANIKAKGIINAKEQIGRCQEAMLSANNSYENAYVQFTRANKELTTLLYAPENDTINYDIVHTHPNIIDFDVNNDSILLKFRTPLAYFDRVTLTRYIQTPSHPYNRQPALKKMYDALFIDETHKMFFTTDVRWSITTNTINTSIERDARTYYREHPLRILESIPYPNPHIGLYNCFGSNNTAITKALSENKIEYAIELVNACLMSITVSDGSVMEIFNNFLNYATYSQNIKELPIATKHKMFLRNSDKTELTLSEMIADLEANNG